MSARIPKELIAPQQEQEQHAIALATTFAENPEATKRTLEIFLTTLIVKWDRETVQMMLDRAAERAERTC